MIDHSIAKNVIGEVGVGPRDREDDSTIFERNCLSWINQWVENANELALKQEACAFLFHAEISPSTLIAGSVQKYLFNKSYPISLAGSAYVCTPTLNTVFQKTIPLSNPDVSNIVSWIINEKLENCFVILFLPRLLKVFIKPLNQSINSDEDFSEIQIRPQASREPFDLNSLDHVLDFFYIYAVETHRGTCRIWEDSKKRELVLYPEDMVHRSLHQTLLTHIDYRGAGVTKIEVYNTKGRKDIEIIVNRNGEFAIGILELKVLFPKYTEEKNLQNAIDGIDQVVDYRSTTTLHKVESGYTCLFDGRKVDTAMPDFFAHAKANSVEGRRYFMTTDTVSRTILDFKQ